LHLSQLDHHQGNRPPGRRCLGFRPAAGRQGTPRKISWRKAVNFFPALVTEEHPLELKEEISTEVLGLDDASVRTEQPIRAELVVQKDEENFLATGWATTSLSLICGRCAGWLPCAIRAKVEHLFEAPHP